MERPNHSSSFEAAPAESPPPDLSALQSSVQRFHPWEARRIEGSIPPSLHTTLVRVGPGLMERFGQRLSHAFEADGAMVGLKLNGDGPAQSAVALVKSPGYRAEQAAGRALFGSTAPWWRRFTNGLRGRSKSTGNTSILYWQGRMFALMEGAQPVEVDPTTLDTQSVCDFGGVLGPNFSAHPHRIASQRTTYNFGVNYGHAPTAELYALPDDGPARTLGRVSLPWNSMVHDFAVTERYAVFIICPVKLRLGRALLAPRDLQRIFSWNPGMGAELIIVPWDACDRAVRVPIETRFVFHLANAHLRENDLVVDFFQYPNFDAMRSLSGDDPNAPQSPPHLQRIEVDPKDGTVHHDHALWEHPSEFPVIAAEDVGQPYSTLWFVTAENKTHGRGIARFDVQTAEIDEWIPDSSLIASEPIFVPRTPEGGTEGWLLSIVLDGRARESYFGIFDAQRPSEGPMAKVWMGQPLPNTFHGAIIG